MAAPLVSVVIPVFNAGGYLRAAVLSILEQSYKNLEVIIIDDGSTDDCMDSIKDLTDHRIRLCHQPNAGRTSALNRGLETLSGEFYATQDADDISYPTRIERQVECLQVHTELAAVFTGWDVIFNGRTLAPRFKSKTPEECKQDVARLRMPAHDPSAMYRVSLVRSFRYDPTMKLGGAFDYILQVGERFPLRVLGECLYSYRVHPNSTVQRNLDRTQQCAEGILARASKRRGAPLAPTLLDPPSARPRWRENGVITQFVESALDLRRAGQPGRALTTAWECLRLRPFDRLYYKPLIYALLPEKLIRLYRARKTTTEAL